MIVVTATAKKKNAKSEKHVSHERVRIHFRVLPRAQILKKLVLPKKSPWRYSFVVTSKRLFQTCCSYAPPSLSPWGKTTPSKRAPQCRLFLQPCNRFGISPRTGILTLPHGTLRYVTLRSIRFNVLTQKPRNGDVNE
jgi:hypothetical protein